MEQSELPCIVQALPAVFQALPAAANVEHQYFELPCIVQALPALKRDIESSSKRDVSTRSPQSISKRAKESFVNHDDTTSSPQVQVSSRCTRSQAAPDWTIHETLVLVNEIAAVDEGWFRALSSFQKWKIISDYCMESDVIRSSNQCKRRWESLLADYRKIREWESRSGVGSYWHLDADRRKELGLLVLFDQEVYDSMDAFIKAEEAQKSIMDCDTEDLIGIARESETAIVTADAELLDADPALDSEEDRKNETQESSDKAWELASKLQVNAEDIHSILRRELEDNASCNHALVDLSRPNAMETEFARRQADELIKAFGGLVTTLNQFSELIKDGGIEGIGAMK